MIRELRAAQEHVMKLEVKFSLFVLQTVNDCVRLPPRKLSQLLHRVRRNLRDWQMKKEPGNEREKMILKFVFGWMVIHHCHMCCYLYIQLMTYSFFDSHIYIYIYI